eukprot:3062484-Lingulodinium_polyedra.AAC.1
MGANTTSLPICRTTGPNSYYNSLMHYETWNNHHAQNLPHIQYCGQVATKQVEHGRYFIREQPAGTWIDHVELWGQV